MSQINFRNATEETYYIHSTALGGETLVELNTFGDKSKGYVYGPKPASPSRSCTTFTKPSA